MGLRNRISSIRVQIIVAFFLLVFSSIIAFMLFSVGYTRSSLKANSKENSEELVQQVNYNIENYMDYMENIAQVVMHNTSIEQFLFGEEAAGDQAKAKLGEELEAMLQIRKDICNIAVLGQYWGIMGGFSSITGRRNGTNMPAWNRSPGFRGQGRLGRECMCPLPMSRISSRAATTGWLP